MQLSLAFPEPMREVPHGIDSERRRRAYPLDRFPPDHQAWIAEQVSWDKPPPRWLDLGVAQISSRGWWEWHWQRGIDPDKRRESIPAWVRSRVINRDGYVCGICGGDVEPTDVHLDHIKPVSRGGPTTLENLRVTHSLCNIRKGARY